MRRPQLAQFPGPARRGSRKAPHARLEAFRDLAWDTAKARMPPTAPTAGASVVRYRKSHQPGLCRTRGISLIGFSNFHVMRIIRIRAISRAFQTRLVFMYMHYVLLDAAYVLSWSQFQFWFQGIVYEGIRTAMISGLGTSPIHFPGFDKNQLFHLRADLPHSWVFRAMVLPYTT